MPVVSMKSATHVCAALTLAYMMRGASFAKSWFEVPLLDDDPGPLPVLSVIVPARDEERSIEACVRSLCAQRFVTCEVIVVDDRSRDATPLILERLAAEFENLRVVRGSDLPPGWIGKPWALEQGARHANGEWLLFTDADSVHAPAGVASGLHFTRGRGADALSIVTGQELATFWERAVLPSILGMLLLASGTLDDLNDPLKPDRALANGQYILVRRAAYEALGGHRALGGEIVEDVAFARRLKADGRFRLLFADGHRLARVRMYHSFHEIWQGFTKNVYAGADGRLEALFGGLATVALTSILPPLLALRHARRRQPLLAAEALACTVATISASSWAYRLVGFSARLALLQPLGTAVFGAIILNSTWRVRSGRGVDWRGRTYSGRKSTRPRLIGGE
jgi:chlorobactene glucosyltransferase